MVRMFLQWTANAGISACVLFVDVVSAFDALVREHLFDQQQLDADAVRMLQRLGVGRRGDG
eukprot:15469179-Alexandrium_andersonii.AAC.1